MTARLLYVDPAGGVAGDMLCAALLDLGRRLGAFDLDDILADLAPLGLPGWSARVESVRRGGLAALRFVVEAAEHHHHRTWATIRPMLDRLRPGVRDRARAAFAALARAEGRVHGVDPEAVHFHEVGAVDSIVDTCAAAAALDRLGVARLLAGPLPVARGTVHTAHGPMPLPAPATLALLEGWPLRPGEPGVEQVTPTGAALLAALGEPGEIPAMRLLGSGTGAGSRDPEGRPNVVRVLLGEAAGASADGTPETVVQLAAQVDDMTGEQLPAALAALLDAGALDAWATPVHMKKGRAGLLVEALAEPAAAEAVERAFLEHTTTFGVRRHPVHRRVLDRSFETARTPWGPVRVKVGRLDGRRVQASPEHADLAAIARATGLPLHRVHSHAMAAWHRADPEAPAPRGEE